MQTVMKEIYHHQSHAFKINLSFLFILQHRETLEYRYFYASNNEQLLKSARLIRNQQYLQNLLNHLSAKDFPSLLKEQRPNTKWVIERIVNLRIHLVITTYPLGKPPHLPDYIKNNRHIIGLEKDNNSAYRYKDHFCFFRCLAIGKFGKTRLNCDQKAKELFQDYCKHFRVKPQDFEGIELDELPELEKHYEVQLFAMFLKEDGTAKTPYLSRASFPTKIYMNVYENHLSYIKDIKMYSKQYICNRCDKVFARMENLNKHQSKCDGTVKYVFPGGVYKINCLCLRNWRKWEFVYMRRTNMKSGLRVSILRPISVILMKRWMVLKKTHWKWKRGRHGTKYMKGNTRADQARKTVQEEA